MMKRPNVFIGAGFIALLGALGISQSVLERKALAQGGGGISAPRFEVDPMWPKPLPNHWILGSVVGVAVDADDHIWVTHRGTQTVDENEKRLDSKTGNCCAVAPPILEFDQEIGRAHV